MQKWILEGLMIGMASVVIGGGVSILMPENSKATLAGGTLGAMAGSVVLSKRHRQVLAKTELRLKSVQTELIDNQAELSNSRTNIFTLENKLQLTQSEFLILQANTSNSQANILTLESQLKLAQAEIIATQTEASNAQDDVSILLEQLEPEPTEPKINVVAFQSQHTEATFIIDAPSNESEAVNGSKDK
jgi:septal ring factor EnvC (AmiA/AmiB activator)